MTGELKGGYYINKKFTLTFREKMDSLDFKRFALIFKQVQWQHYEYLVKHE